MTLDHSEMANIIKSLEEAALDNAQVGPLIDNGGSILTLKCRACGSSRRLFEDVLKYLLRHNKARPDTVPYSSMNTIIIQPLNGSIDTTTPTYTIYRDICKGCGLEYPVLITRKDISIAEMKEIHV